MKALYWLLPIGLSYLRLKALGVFDGGRVGVPGSDFYAYAAGAQLMLDHPSGIPSVITQFQFPEGVDKATIPQLFSDWLWRVWLKALLLIRQDPIWAMWMGLVTSTLAGIWGVWGLLWKRLGKTAPLAAAIGWAVLCLSPSPWHRTAGHWYLSWIPILFWCALQWWDFWVSRDKPKLRWMFVSHFLLMAQSVYFAVYLLFLMAIWALVGARDLLRDRAFARSFLAISAAAALGYAASAAISIQSMGGLQALSTAKSGTQRSTAELYQYSFRLRELLKGGPESPWNRAAEKLWGQKPKGSFGQDGETFPAPFPKSFLLLTLGLGIYFGRRKSQPLIADETEGRAMRFGAWGVLGLFIIGSQETHWLRTQVIHHFFPFIRAYSRLVVLMIAVTALWLAGVWSKRIQAALATRSPLLGGATLAFAIALLGVDYGWKQSLLELIPSHPCREYFDIAKNQGLPILWHQAPSAPSDWACSRNHYDPYPNTGMPLLTGFWSGARRDVPAPGTEQCSSLRNLLKLAADTHPSHAVLWWFEGSPQDWETTRDCLNLPRGEIVLQRTISASGAKVVFSRWRSL